MAGAVNAVRQRVRRHPRRAWTAAAVVLVLVATGLVAVIRSWTGGASEFTVVDDAHLNASRDLGMEEVITAGFHGDALVVLGKTTGTGVRVAVVEADTGEIRWVRDSGMRIDDDAVLDGNEQSVPTNPTKTLERPVITGSGEDWSVVVGYAVTEDGSTTDQLDLDTADVQERGVAALSGADGSVDFKQETPGFPRPLDADEDTVLVGAKHSEEAANVGDVTSMALDSSDNGAVRWEHEGDWVHTLAGDTVLGESAPADWQPGADATNEGHQVFALDTRTGQPAWEASDDGSSVRAATDGRAVLDVDNGAAGSNSNPGVDAATGEEITAPDGGLSGYAECATGAGGMLACVSVDETVEVMTVAPGEDEARVSTADVEFDPSASASVDMNSVAEGRVHFTLSSEEADSGSERDSVAVDRDGTLLADDLPAAVGDTAGNNAILDRGQPGGPWELTVNRSADDGAEPPAGPSSAPEVEPLAVAEEPLWGVSVNGGVWGAAPPPHSTNDSDLEGVSAVHLAGDTLVYAGETDDGYRVVAVDPATGEQRWSEDRGGDDPGYRYPETGVAPVVTGENDDVLLIPDGPETDHDSVTAVSVADGSVLWEEEVGSGDGSTRLDGVDDEVAAVSDHDREDGSTIAVRTELRDVTDGSVVHTEEDVEPAGLGGGVVVGREHNAPYESSDPADDVLGFDPHSGEEQWRLGDRYEQPEVLSVDDASVVLTHAHGTAVLDPATGEEIGAAATRITECFGSAEPLLACHVGDHMSGDVFPATVEVADGNAHVRVLPGLTGHTAHPGLGQWMPVTSGVAEAGSQDRYQLRDAQGRQVIDGLAGWVAEADDDHVVLVDGALGERSIEGVTVTVHERQ